MQVRSDARAARRPDVRAAVLLSAGLASSSASAADPAACTWQQAPADGLRLIHARPAPPIPLPAPGCSTWPSA
jgi:hypothetical protein